MRDASTRAGSNTARSTPRRDDPDPAGLHVIGLDDVACDERRDRDDPLTPRHDRVVAPLQRPAGGISAVDRGDEGPSCAPRRVTGEPGGPARAGMDQINIFIGDEPGEAPDRARRL